VTAPLPAQAGNATDVTCSDFDALNRLLTERWSCRSFREEQVPHETIEQMLTIAQRSPSWCNTQPWQVVVTAGNGTERLRTAMSAWARSGPAEHDFAAPTEYRGVYRERRRDCAYQLYISAGIRWGDREASAEQSLRNFEFFGAPHVAIITSPVEFGVYGALDGGLYIANFLLAAQALGLGAVPQAAIAAHSPQLRAFLGIPDSRGVLAAVSFGYASESEPVNTYRTPRAPLEQSVTWLED
jgi:nitroreductase